MSAISWSASTIFSFQLVHVSSLANFTPISSFDGNWSNVLQAWWPSTGWKEVSGLFFLIGILIIKSQLNYTMFYSEELKTYQDSCWQSAKSMHHLHRLILTG